MRPPDSILAKSQPPLSLPQHTRDVLTIRELLRPQFPQVAAVAGAWFWDALWWALLLHDMGKAHQQFQRVLAGQAVPEWQGQRHELFSLPLVAALVPDPTSRQRIEWAVAGHHRDFEHLSSFLRERHRKPVAHSRRKAPTFEDDFNTYVNLGEVREVLRQWQVELPPTVLPGNPLASVKLPSEGYYVADPDGRALTLLAGAFQHCDHLGSAQLRALPTLDQSQFGQLTTRLASWTLHQHQQQAAHTSGNALLTAPTGAGKTETALLWLHRQVQELGASRLFYVLPNRASINAMHRRMQDIFGGELPAVLHGKLSDFLYRTATLAEDSRDKRLAQMQQLREQFRTLARPVKTLTPFQLIKHLYGLRGFEKGWFEWVGACFVFDEIHAYEPKVFAELVLLIEVLTQQLGARVLVMTATLPTHLRQRLQVALGSHTPIGAAPALYPAFNRHRVAVLPGRLAAHIGQIAERLITAKPDGTPCRVLVVANTVAQAQEIFDKLKGHVPKAVLLHGRFNSRDRADKEKELEQSEAVQLLVGTQAIEVSLDIDFDVIYSEPAPLDALIQRLGRVNRRRQKGLADCFIFEEANPTDRFIYKNREVLRRTLEKLAEVAAAGGVLKEAQLQQYLDFVYDGWLPDEQKAYEMQWQLLSDYLHYSLRPFYADKTSEEEFYRKFDGVPVVPQCLEAEYQRYLADFNFLDAEALTVSLRAGTFAGGRAAHWITEHQAIAVHETAEDQDPKLKRLTYYVIHQPYSSELGLQIPTRQEPRDDFEAPSTTNGSDSQL